MKTKIELAYLYDFYGELLNEHQRQIYEDFVLNDLSLGEIAAEEGISRQGVHDLIKRCSRKLQDYEDKLHLVEKFQNMKEKLTKATELLTVPDGEVTNLINIEKAKQLMNEMLTEL